MALSKKSRETILSLLEMRRDQEACNVKRALRSAEYKRGMAAEVEYVRVKRESVKQLQAIIDELNGDSEDAVLSDREFWVMMDALYDKVAWLENMDADLRRDKRKMIIGIPNVAMKLDEIGEERTVLDGVIDKMAAMFGGGDTGDG